MYGITKDRITNSETLNDNRVMNWYPYQGKYLPKVDITNIDGFAYDHRNGHIVMEYPQLELNIRNAKNRKKGKTIDVPVDENGNEINRNEIMSSIIDGINEENRENLNLSENED